MPFINSNSVPPTSNGWPGFTRAPGLVRYPGSRAPVRRLSGYSSAPWLTTYPNGDPIPTVDSGDGSDALKSLVMAALQNHMAVRCGCKQASGSSGMGRHHRRWVRGMGDATYDPTDPSSGPPDITDQQAAPPSDTSSGPYGILGPGEVLNPDGSISVDQVPGTVGSAPLSNIAGAPQYAAPTAATVGSSLANFFNALFRPAGTPGIVPYGQSLSQPLYSGAPISTGSIFLIGGVALFVILLAKRR